MQTTRPGDEPERGSASAMRRFYDAYGAQEIDRLAKDIPGRVAFEIHRRFAARFLRPGQRVLEIGAGPGRFTVALAELGALITVADISPVQLALNQEYVTAAGADGSVERRDQADIRDLSRYATGSFDGVVAYGGPLSYAFEQEAQAMSELARVTRPGGWIIASVMSRWGTWRSRFPAVTELEREHGQAVGDLVLRTGDLRHVPDMEHVCRMFTWAEVEALASAAGVRILDGSASNWTSLDHPAILAELETDVPAWNRFLDHETEACSSPGAWDGGTHILFAAERPSATTLSSP